MKYQILFDQTVKKILTHMPPLRKKQIKESLRTLASDPYIGKELQEELTGLMSLRVGTYRIIYKTNPKTHVIHVIAIGPRRSIYEECEKITGTKKKS